MKPAQRTFARNEHAHALHARAGNASVAIRVDTRPKAVKPKKGKGSYRRAAAVNGADADCRR
jgi:stalled ribosome alternative rescue factor ArfA